MIHKLMAVPFLILWILSSLCRPGDSKAPQDAAPSAPPLRGEILRYSPENQTKVLFRELDDSGMILLRQVEFNEIVGEMEILVIRIKNLEWPKGFGVKGATEQGAWEFFDAIQSLLTRNINGQPLGLAQVDDDTHIIIIRDTRLAGRRIRELIEALDVTSEEAKKEFTLRHLKLGGVPRIIEWAREKLANPDPTRAQRQALRWPLVDLKAELERLQDRYRP